MSLFLEVGVNLRSLCQINHESLPRVMSNAGYQCLTGMRLFFDILVILCKNNTGKGVLIDIMLLFQSVGGVGGAPRAGALGWIRLHRWYEGMSAFILTNLVGLCMFEGC